jgi:hypothetical protein
MYIAKTKTPRKTNRSKTNRLKAKLRAKNKKRRANHIGA